MNRIELLQSYIKGYDELAEIIQGASSEMLYFKPAENKWSAVEVIIHLADAECNANVRFRKAIAESGSNVDVYDHNAWAQRLDYQHQDVVIALALFKLLRASNYPVLSSLKEEVWENFVIHPEHGKVTLRDLLKIYVEHLQTHVKQIKRNFDSFNNLNNK